MIKHALLVAALVFPGPASAQFIPAAPGSMWFGATWEDADRLDKDFTLLSWATDGKLFSCEFLSPNWGWWNDTQSYTPPVVTPPIYVYASPPAAAAPEPSTWALVLVGMGLLFINGLGRKLRKNAS